jgi:mycothiol synthase
MTTTQPPAASRTPVPGLRIRPYAGEEDLSELVRLENAEYEADGIRSRVSLEEQRTYYAHPSDSFDPARDVVIAEVDGQAVGYGMTEWVDDRAEDLREYRLGGSVDPAWRRRGIGAALFADNQRRSLERAATHDTARRRVFGSFTGENQAGRIALLRDDGFTEVRWFFDMERPDLDDIPDAPLPDGLEVRPITRDLYRQVWDADVEAFRDHWGGHDESEESMRRHFEAPTTDPSLWVIAFDGDEIAGGVINTIYPEENEALGVKRGWLDSVFTRRPWRRRGLARALIARSLARLRERGMTGAVLGVDADNPLGALGLYESAGFRVVERFSAWRKPMDQAR